MLLLFFVFCLLHVAHIFILCFKQGCNHWNTICTQLFFAQLACWWGDNHYFKSAKGLEFWISCKVRVDLKDGESQRTVSLPLWFSGWHWFLGGPLGSSGAFSLGVAFHLEDPAAPYIPGQSCCNLHEGLNFIISGMRACLLGAAVRGCLPSPHSVSHPITPPCPRAHTVHLQSHSTVLPARRKKQPCFPPTCPHLQA